MCEEILPGLFRLKIPLPDNPLKYLNSYVIKSLDRSLIIDTGLNRRECLEAMQAGLSTIGIDLKASDIFITSHIYFNRPEKEIMESWEGFGTMIEYGGQNGFPENELRTALDKHPGAKYGSEWIPAMKLLEDGDGIDVGDYHFKCVATPGHTIGHICLYEPDKEIMIAGDHILIDITPNIQCWSDTQNPLKHYLASLEKVYSLKVDLTLPGHRRLIRDHKARIKELKHHHADRLTEVLSILNRGGMNAFQVASQMTWDIDSESWDQFPVAQKWFATGEAISHLRYLEEEGKLARQSNGKMTLYAVVK